jgi:heptosyltransferase III
VWTAGHNVPLVRFADRVRSILSTGIDAYPPRLDALGRFDEIVSWYGTNRPEFRAAANHLPIRFLDALPASNEIHATDFYMRQVGGRDGGIPEIPCERADRDFVAFHPFSGSPKKNWPYFGELASRLKRRVLFCVSPEQSWPGAVQYENLYELAQWLATASLYVGNDSGITHLAAAVGVPVVAIFRASDPGVWLPRSRARVIGLQDPTVEDTARAVDQISELCP